jgi:hypothetical protein
VTASPASWTDDTSLSGQIELAHFHFNPLQPRIPPGLPGAGRWTSGYPAREALSATDHLRSLTSKARQLLTETASDAGEVSHPASPEVRRFVSASAGHVPSLLGGGHETFTGTVKVEDKLSHPRELAAMDWNGDMVLRSDVHNDLGDLVHSTGPGHTENAMVVLHELIHGLRAPGAKPDAGEYWADENAYQDLGTAQLEEGFTELGAIQHGQDYLEAMGIADRPSANVKGKTMGQEAAIRAGPARIRAGTAWGHYQQQTAAAYDWAKEIARAEGIREGGAPLQNRIQQISDEINRVGTADKLDVMAQQVINAGAKGATLEPAEVDGIKDQIRANFARSQGADAVFAAMGQASQAVMRQQQETAARQAHEFAG